MLLEGVYGSFKLTEDSTKKLSEWIKDNNVIEPVEDEDFHITTTYSKVDPEQEIIPSEKNNIRLDHKEFSIATYGLALVIEVESKDLETIHKSAIDSGASYDYETYKPHITISYNAEANENIIPLIFPPDFDIVLSHEEVEPLKEEFEMDRYYKFWGWVKPNGSLLLPTEKMRIDDKNHTHASLFRDNTKLDYNMYTYEVAYEQNYIRFFIDDDNLLIFDCPNTVPISTVEKGYKNILSYVRTKQLDIMKIFNHKLTKLNGFVYFLNKFDEKEKRFMEYDHGRSFPELISVLENIQESDAPANSTSNIATYAKPLTLKLFKRKIILE